LNALQIPTALCAKGLALAEFFGRSDARATERTRYVAHGSILAAALAYGVTGSEDLRYAELPFVPATTLAFLPQRFGETV